MSEDTIRLMQAHNAAVEAYDAAHDDELSALVRAHGRIPAVRELRLTGSRCKVAVRDVCMHKHRMTVWRYVTRSPGTSRMAWCRDCGALRVGPVRWINPKVRRAR